MISAALETINLTAVLAAIRDQEAHGHTADTDADRAVVSFGDDLVKRALECRDVLYPGERQNLPIGYRRAARLAAYAIATMRRIQTEQQRTEGGLDNGTE
jgi:hypothetical protein